MYGKARQRPPKHLGLFANDESQLGLLRGFAQMKPIIGKQLYLVCFDENLEREYNYIIGFAAGLFEAF